MTSLPDFTYELPLWKSGYKYVVGIDEVGRGSFAGPLVVAGVIFPAFSKPIQGVNDSKLLSARQRERLYQIILSEVAAYSIVEISVADINSIGIGGATQVAFSQIITQISIKPDYVLVDAFTINSFDSKKQMGIIRGDQKSITIAAASIIAKVYRDQLMVNLHTQHPAYGFDQNKGYGTGYHRKALVEFGLSEVHRTQFCQNTLKRS